MRGKRSKQYRKLMQQYGLGFGFREPYQVVVDAAILQDAKRFKMDIMGGLERTLHGKIKPMITQCSIRHLYNAIPKDDELIDQAKTYERRRCGHHTLEEPLNTIECLSSVVDSKDNQTNKHRYVIASQDLGTRAHMRGIPGVPLIYINRSVMIMEPMTDESEILKRREERQKLKSGLKSKAAPKRKFDEIINGADQLLPAEAEGKGGVNGMASRDHTQPESVKKKRRGPKGPNPLSVKKPKKRPPKHTSDTEASKSSIMNTGSNGAVPLTVSGIQEDGGKKKRRRKHNRANEAEEDSLET